MAPESKKIFHMTALVQCSVYWVRSLEWIFLEYKAEEGGIIALF